MQRRTGKPTPHIAPPLTPDMGGGSRSSSFDSLLSHNGGSSHEKAPSRLAQKSLGVTNRIWLILLLFLSLILFTRFVLPSESPSTARHRLLHSDLKPKNYLNLTSGSGADGAGEVENPFSFCPALGPGDELVAKYDPMLLAKTRFHLGSGARVQRVITRALSGHPVTISIVGGSVSACHGAGDDPLSPTCYPSRFFNWWNDVFPHPASELTNGAMRRTNSQYFSFCNAHHVPDVADMVIVELDVDDEADQESMEHFELLIRSLLLRPDQPAVVILGHFSPQNQETNGFLGPDHWHSVVAQFYDVPHISVKPLLYTQYMQDPTYVQRKYYADPVLANPAGHELLADVLISYFQSRTCAAWSALTGTASEALLGPGVPIAYGGKKGDSKKQPTDAKGIFGGLGQRIGAAGAAAFEPLQQHADSGDADVDPVVNKNPVAPAPVAAGEKQADQGETNVRQALAANHILYPHFRVPASRINTRPTSDEPPEVAPFCVSANDLVNPLPASLFTGSGTGWSVYHPAPGSAELSSHAHYWYSSLPTSRLRVSVQVSSGDIGIYYLKEPVSGPEEGMGVGEGSAVECWVDDNFAGAVMIENAGNVGEPKPTLEMIDHNVGPGSHFVECQLAGEEDDRNVPPFKIIGIFAS
ncbi:hypothetical protein QCA50_013414 [Cerrena zonata]|uniref:Capsular associated protein n=1 Tax=Cerrena zonata TaxID=2478898 RepID=A0AAW0FRV6_9APHY